MWHFVNTAGMSVPYMAAGISVVLLFLQLIGKCSLARPALVYTGILLFPAWCVYTGFHIFIRMKNVLDSYESSPGSLLTVMGNVSGTSILGLLWALLVCSIPYLLFLTGYVKINLFPCKSARKASTENREAAARMTCLRLCRYALFMLAVYLPIAAYILIRSFEPIVLGVSMLAMSLPWGIAGTLLAIIIVPPLGLILGFVLAGLGTFTFSLLMTPLLFVALLLTVALVLTWNAVIRTCRYTKRKALGYAFLATLPGINLCMLVYLLICLSKQSEVPMTNGANT